MFRRRDTLRSASALFERSNRTTWFFTWRKSSAVIVGDTLIDRGNGLEVHPEWPVEAVTAADVAERFRPLSPPHVVLPTHADPTIARRSSERCR